MPGRMTRPRPSAGQMLGSARGQSSSSCRASSSEGLASVRQLRPCLTRPFRVWQAMRVVEGKQIDLLYPLVGTLDMLRRRISVHRDLLQENETRTRVALVDPLLSALGWDVSDPAVVVPEYRVRSGSADYALLGADAKPRAIVEAKRLGESLTDKHRTQVVAYASVVGSSYVALTNGRQWEMYEVFKPGELEERRRLNVALDRESESSAQLAIQFLWLWKANLEQGDAVGSPDLPVDPTPPGPQPPSDGIPLSEFKFVRGAPKPTGIIFPDSEQKPVRAWWHVLSCTAEWLVRVGKLKIDNTPVQSTREGSFLVGHVDDHRWNPRWPIEIAGTGMQIDRHGSGAVHMRRAKTLLERLGEDPGRVYLEQPRS